MSLDSLKGLLNGLDPAALLPDLPNLLGKLASGCRIAVLVVPVLLVLLGLWYLLLPPKEATYEVGMRCWWGMGSVRAWRFTQKFGGILWSVMGLAMGVAMYLLSKTHVGLGYQEVLMLSVQMLLWEIGLIIASIIVINVTLIVLFDAKGVRRSEKKKAKEPA